MRSVADSGDNREWLLLRSLIDGRPRFVGVIPELPPVDVRATFPERITIVVAYEADSNGLPLYSDDLEALNGLEEDIRALDLERQVFLNVARSTGLGNADGSCTRRTWTLWNLWPRKTTSWTFLRSMIRTGQKLRRFLRGCGVRANKSFKPMPLRGSANSGLGPHTGSLRPKGSERLLPPVGFRDSSGECALSFRVVSG